MGSPHYRSSRRGHLPSQGEIIESYYLTGRKIKKRGEGNPSAGLQKNSGEDPHRKGMNCFKERCAPIAKSMEEGKKAFKGRRGKGVDGWTRSVHAQR